MECLNCGHKVNKNDKYCYYCGNTIHSNKYYIFINVLIIIEFIILILLIALFITSFFV
jgi:RNA polymerase subunit RPABC4/transcription elongation factor Spt4